MSHTEALAEGLEKCWLLRTCRLLSLNSSLSCELVSCFLLQRIPTGTFSEHRVLRLCFLDKCTSLTMVYMALCFTCCLQRHAEISKYKAERKTVPKRLERDISAENFLRALCGPLRKVTYQHLALVFDRYPDHPLCNHILMDSDEELSRSGHALSKT